MSKKNLVFVLGSLNIGGAEKVMINYLNTFYQLHKDEYHVEVFLISKDGDLLDYLNPNIPISFLYRGNKFLPNNLVIRNVYRVYRKLLSILFRNYPTTLSILIRRFKRFDYGFYFVQDLIFLSRMNFGFKKLIWIQNNLKQVENNYLYTRNKLQNDFEYIIANSVGIYNDLIGRLKIDSKKVKLCYNPIDIEHIEELSKEPVENYEFLNRPYILSVGRCVEQKKFDVLIDSFQLIHQQFDLNLVIVGDGKLFSELVHLAKTKSLSKRIFFTGNLANPYPIMANALMFVCSSMYEGLPTAMIESMSLGIPIVSTPCEFGPREILNYGEYGILCKDLSKDSISESIRYLLESEDQLRLFQSLSRLRSQDFSAHRAVSNLIKIIQE